MKYIQQNYSRNFSNLEKDMPIQVQDASRTSNKHDQNRTSPWNTIVKSINIENNESIRKAGRVKNQITYKSIPSKQQQISQEKP
jgi:hypothetical protein